MDTRLFGLAAVWMLSLTGSAYAIRCYQCYNVEYFGHYNKGCESGNTTLLASAKVECSPGLTRCIKTVLQGIVTRTCSGYVEAFDKTCQETDGNVACSCATDDCNAANGRHQLQSGAFSATMVLLAMIPVARNLLV